MNFELRVALMAGAVFAVAAFVVWGRVMHALSSQGNRFAAALLVPALLSAGGVSVWCGWMAVASADLTALVERLGVWLIPASAGAMASAGAGVLYAVRCAGSPCGRTPVRKFWHELLKADAD